MMRKYIVKKIKMTSEVSKTCQAYRKNVVVKMATTSYMYCCNQEGCFLATGCRVKKKQTQQRQVQTSNGHIMKPPNHPFIHLTSQARNAMPRRSLPTL